METRDRWLPPLTCSQRCYIGLFYQGRQHTPCLCTYLAISKEESFPDRHIGPTIVQSERTDISQGGLFFLPVQCCKVVGCIFPFVCLSSASVPSDFELLGFRKFFFFLRSRWSCLEAVRHRENSRHQLLLLSSRAGFLITDRIICSTCRLGAQKGVWRKRKIGWGGGGAGSTSRCIQCVLLSWL